MATSAINGFSTPNATSGYSDGWVRQSIGIPVGRTAASGQGPITVTQLQVYISGRLAARTVSVSLGGASTGSFSVASAGSAQQVNPAISATFANGGSALLQYNFSGSSYFGRYTGAGGTVEGAFGNFTSSLLAGVMTYAQVPTAPSITSVTTSGTSATVNLAGSSDDGGSAITAYRLEYATDAGFVSGGGGIETLSSSIVINGLTAGQTYYFRLAAKNAVTVAAGTFSQWSATSTVTIRTGGKVWNGTSWVPATVKVWNGTSWVTATVKVWNGTSWVTAT